MFCFGRVDPAWKDWERKASNFPPEVAFQLYSFHCQKTTPFIITIHIFVLSPNTPVLKLRDRAKDNLSRISFCVFSIRLVRIYFKKCQRYFSQYYIKTEIITTAII